MLNSQMIEIVANKVFEKYPEFSRVLHLSKQIESMNIYSMYLSEGMLELKRIIFRKETQDFTLNFLKDVWDTYILEGVSKEEMIAYAEDAYQLLKNDSQLSKVYSMLLPPKQKDIPPEKEFLSIYDTIFVQIIMFKLISLRLVKLCTDQINVKREEEQMILRQNAIRKQKEETLKQLNGMNVNKGNSNGNRSK